MAAIFGASASAASISEVEVAGDVAELGLAAAVAPLEAESQIDEEVVDIDELLEQAEPVDLEAMAELNAAARAEATEVDSTEEAVDSDALIGSAVIERSGTAGSLSEVLNVRPGAASLNGGAETGSVVEVLDEVETRQPDASPAGEADADTDIDIDAIIAERDAAIALLESQAQAVRDAQAQAEEDAARAAEAEAAAAAAEAAANANLSVGERAAVLSRQLGRPSSESEAQAAWDAGYNLGGGRNLSAFHSTILPCESGSQANRDTVVGATDDWGRAQINRPVWSSTFRSLTGIVFEEGVVQPVLNGYMAAHIEQVQGLSAWTCWRNR